MATLSTDMVYQLHVRLADIEPPIWRQIVVPGQVTLFGFHRMLQVVMGWENSHLHQFIVGSTYYGEPDPEFEDGMNYGGKHPAMDAGEHGSTVSGWCSRMPSRGLRWHWRV